MVRYVGTGLGLVCLALLGAVPARAADIEKYLPEDTQTVAGINVRQILDSNLVKKFGLEPIKAVLASQQEAQKVLQELGFDPFKDLDTIVVAGPGGTDADKGLIIVHGTFDVAKFEAKAEQVAKNKGEQFQIEKVGNHKVYKAAMQDQTFYASFAGKTTLLVSPGKDYLATALDRAASKEAATIKSAAVQKLLAQVDTKQSMWLVIPGSAFPKELPIDNEKLKKSLESIESVVGGINFTDDIKVKFLIATKDAAGAKALVETIKGGLEQARAILPLLGGDKLAPLADVLGSVKTTTEGKTVTLGVVIGADVIEKLQKGQ